MTNDSLLTKIHLVMDKLIHLGGADYEKDKEISLSEAIRTGNVSRDFGIEEWDWPQGVGLYGLCKLQDYYGDKRFIPFFEKWFQDNLKKGLPSRNINTTAPYLSLLHIMDDLKDKEHYQEMCIQQANWLVSELPKTKEGGFQHVTSGIGDRNAVILNESELWIDTLFMAVLFLHQMGLRYNNEVWKAEAEYQILLHIKYLYCKNTGLFYHGFSFNRNDNFGGVFWGRGNSWFTLGITLFLEHGDSFSPGTRRYLETTFQSHVQALKDCQAPSGLFYTVLTDPSSYTEISATSAIAAGILRGIKLGILDDSYQKCADAAIDALCRNIAPDGTVLNVSAGTAMGMNAEHYKGIQIRPMAYGQALALIALCEALHQ